jgi:hypothetical protein
MCKGVDVSIHEAIDPDVLRRLVPDKQRMDAIGYEPVLPERVSSCMT